MNFRVTLLFVEWAELFAIKFYFCNATFLLFSLFRSLLISLKLLLRFSIVKWRTRIPSRSWSSSSWIIEGVRGAEWIPELCFLFMSYLNDYVINGIIEWCVASQEQVKIIEQGIPRGRLLFLPQSSISSLLSTDLIRITVRVCLYSCAWKYVLAEVPWFHWPVKYFSMWLLLIISVIPTSHSLVVQLLRVLVWTLWRTRSPRQRLEMPLTSKLQIEHSNNDHPASIQLMINALNSSITPRHLSFSSLLPILIWRNYDHSSTHSCRP